MDLQCAQCHDHLFIDDYKQQDFQGLFVVYSNLFLRKDKDLKFPAVGEKPLAKKLEFMSVFDKVTLETGPRLPGGQEFEMPDVRQRARSGWSRRTRRRTSPACPSSARWRKIAEQLPTAENTAFARNIVNRLWFVLMGRGLVHPLDLHHSEQSAVASRSCWTCWPRSSRRTSSTSNGCLGELARSQTYQRASELPEGQAEPAAGEVPGGDREAALGRATAASMLVATGERRRYEDAKKREELRTRFVKAFANPPREPEVEFAPSLQGALFVLNDANVLDGSSRVRATWSTG